MYGRGADILQKCEDGTDDDVQDGVRYLEVDGMTVMIHQTEKTKMFFL